jgi:putative spermidine/putrescine transport system permease protein
MLTNFGRPRELPIVNVVALFVILVSIIPVWIAQRLTREATAVGGTAAAAAGARQ